MILKLIGGNFYGTESYCLSLQGDGFVEVSRDWGYRISDVTKGADVTDFFRL